MKKVEFNIKVDSSSLGKTLAKIHFKLEVIYFESKYPVCKN